MQACLSPQKQMMFLNSDCGHPGPSLSWGQGYVVEKTGLPCRNLQLSRGIGEKILKTPPSADAREGEQAPKGERGSLSYHRKKIRETHQSGKATHMLASGTLIPFSLSFLPPLCLSYL